MELIQLQGIHMFVQKATFKFTSMLLDTLIQSALKFLSVSVIPGIQTHDLGTASTMPYQLSDTEETVNGQNRGFKTLPIKVKKG